MPRSAATGVFIGPETAAYGFGEDHPFGPDRQTAFEAEFRRRRLAEQTALHPPRQARREELELFHTPTYLDFVARRCAEGTGYLDGGDTPALPGIDTACAWVVGTTLAAARQVMQGGLRRAFVPIAGLHHGGRGYAAGFCVYNDCGVAIEALRREYGLQRVAYVDIDAHHGDGVFYAFEADPALIFADLHEDGRFLYPGTGFPEEIGAGPAAGTKLNIPLVPGADDKAFLGAWERVEDHLHAARPEFILFQCGADSIAGDPLTHLRYSPAAHTHAARRLCALADEYCSGRILGLGGGGYDRRNLALAWTGVVEAFVAAG